MKLSNRHPGFLLIGLLLLTVFFVSASYGQRKRKPSRRVTNPVSASPAATPKPSPGGSEADPAIVSTADEAVNEDGAGGVRTNSNAAAPADYDASGVRRRVDRLSTQVTQLNDKLTHIEDDQRSLGDIERLSRAEQRAEDLRAQLRDVQSKQLDYQARLDQFGEEMRPENIDRSIATMGTTHPEELREQRRRQLEADKKRVLAQIELLDRSRQRLEAAVSTADLAVDKLRERVEETTEPDKAKVEKPDTNGNVQPAIP
jgi:chromosome segregation ATPase